MKKRIVMTCFGSFGDVNPYMGLALGLRQRGYATTIATSEYYRSVVEREQIEFHAVRPDVEPQNGELLRRVMDAKRGTEVILRELLFPAIRDSYADLVTVADGADLLISHPVAFAGPLVAEKLKLRWISTVLAPISFFSAHDLPVFPVFPQAVVLRKLGLPVTRWLTGMAKRMTRGWSDPLRRLRTELGLPPGKDPIFEGQFSSRLTLALFSRLLAKPQPDWPPHVRVTGHVFYDRSISGDGLTPELTRFLDAGPAPVVFTLGSSAVGAAGNFYQVSLEAVRRLGCRAILMIGDHDQNRPREPIPETVAITSRAPFSLLFPRAAAIVHQGGVGTTAQALQSGHPMLVVPFAHDQPDNAFRVKNLGVARILYPRQYRAAKVVEELKRLLGNSHYARQARKVADEVRAEDGLGQACTEIEKFLN
ncbi:MAG: glycosyltransferase [Acidobacteriota bacterium]